MPHDEIPPARKFTPPTKFDGPLGKCINLARPNDVEDFIRRWYRAQMRQWAGNWRLSRGNAAAQKKTVAEVANTAIKFAVLYRDSAKSARRRTGV
jgi:hypothetical protein